MTSSRSRRSTAPTCTSSCRSPLSGIATGAIYGLIAVGYSLTFMTTKALNFALGMWVMLGGMLTYSLTVQYGIHR